MKKFLDAFDESGDNLLVDINNARLEGKSLIAPTYSEKKFNRGDKSAQYKNCSQLMFSHESRVVMNEVLALKKAEQKKIEKRHRKEMRQAKTIA